MQNNREWEKRIIQFGQKVKWPNQQSVEFYHHEVRNRQTVIVTFNSNCPIYSGISLRFDDQMKFPITLYIKRVRPNSIMFSFYKAAPL